VVPSIKRAVILGGPICWRCWATDLSRKERGKVVPSKRVRSPLANPIPSLPKAIGPGGHEEKVVPYKKQYGTSVGPDS
jgi:hypothetical protein